MMKLKQTPFVYVFFLLISFSPLHAQEATTVKLDNPMTVKYLKAKLRKSSPRIVLTSTNEKLLKAKI
ncbi:MAG: hypothetical protein OEY51_02615, partial [Cyclobacteriaceae bacterium]|nr:hypothetical protein [Cyclobacteriaceae bacterium]